MIYILCYSRPHNTHKSLNIHAVQFTVHNFTTININKIQYDGCNMDDNICHCAYYYNVLAHTFSNR